MDEMKQDLKEIKVSVQDLVKLGAVHNEILRTHEARSLALQRDQDALGARLRPIEKHVSWVDVVFKIIGAVAIAGLIPLILKYFFDVA